MLWLLLIGLGLSLVILFVRHEQGTIGSLTTNDFASLTVKIAFLVFLGGSVLVIFRERFAKALQAMVFWLVLGLVLALGYTYRFELRTVYDRLMAELVPGRAATAGRIVEIARGRVGEFNVLTQVNGGTIPMVLDTGASAVVLTQEAAKAAGLPLEVLNYNVTVDTANGRTRAASVTLDRIGVGGLIERSVPALIAQPGQLRTSLLGMSFLNRLESWEVRGDKLIMRGYP
ncbi:histidine kinase [Pseudorhodoplanes sinuspersici]|uniref:Histidine kinase n=2 Tax=Pseudorhodoplanes sinuspersici TaxID=1235591 RepID=A0A1W6ZUR3_9HYPH|nr:histidine kinase [Pseudorhodoplanes sinuspersici]